MVEERYKEARDEKNKRVCKEATMTHIAYLPMVPIMPTTASDIKVIAFKTLPSASKFEIKHVVETFYDVEVQKVRTLIMKGKKKHTSGHLFAKPDYKKAYVTLKKPISLTEELFPLRTSAGAKDYTNKKKVVAVSAS